MPSGEDTIVAVATPPGRGGLAVVRLSGPRALPIARGLLQGEPSLEARRATLATVSIRSAAGAEDHRDRAALHDQVIATWFATPASYTGEDLVEVSLHGSPLLAARLVAEAVARGARMARPGEFTLRAFLNGKLDLAQAEAVEDLVTATTEAQARQAYDQLRGTLSERIGHIEREVFELSARLEASIDFPDEGYQFVAADEVLETLRDVERRMGELLEGSRRGRVLREGATVAIVGRTNVGKSTVFNRLAGGERAIVTEIAGTTRDLLTERVDIAGVPVTLVDTAGARETSDPVEREGVSRAARAREAADVVLLVLDGSTPLAPEDEALLRETAPRPRVVVVNKSDLPRQLNLGGEAGGSEVGVSALRGAGIEDLVEAVERLLVGERLDEPAALSNVRHIEALARARGSLREAIESIEAELGQTPEELILSNLQATRDALEEITGRRTTEDLLNEIFSKFCIGK